MNHRFQRSAACALSVLVLLCVAATGAMAQKRNKSAKKMQEATQRASDASMVFRAIMGTRDKGIPRELLNKAEAVAVFPGVIKAAFIIGGRGGHGVISRRIPGG